MEIYNSEFKGAVIDARLAAVPTMQTAISNLETAVAAKYSKPSSGIPETDLDASVQAALALARTAVQSLSDYYTKAQVDDITAAIAASVNSTIGEVVTILPTAGAGTLGKMYYVGPDANGFYDRYVTTYDGSTYSWLALGNTEVDMTQYATVEQLNQLDQRVTEDETVIKKTPTANLLDISKVTPGYFWWTAGPVASASYEYTDKIPVTPGKTYTLQCIDQSDVRSIITIRMIVGYAANDVVVNNGSAENVSSYTAPEGCAYVRVTTIPYINNREAAFVEATEVIPYVEYGNIVGLQDSIVTEAAIADKSVSIEKVSFTKIVYGKNLLDVNAKTLSKWVGATGNLENVSTDWAASDYIPVEPGVDYHLSNKNNDALCSRTDAYIAFYDQDKVFISAVASTNKDVTAPAGSAFMRASLRMDRITNMEPQIERGTMRTAYAEYVAPETIIDPAYIEGGAEESLFNGIRKKNAALAPGTSLQTSFPIYVSKNAVIAADIEGAISAVQIGIGYNEAYGKFIEITPTQVKLYFGSPITLDTTLNHGLTLGTHTKVILDKTVSAGNTGSLNSIMLWIFDDYGNAFSQSISWSSSIGGPAFIRNGNSSGTIAVMLSLMLKDITKSIWIFGDSYLNYGWSTRWPYHLSVLGFLNVLYNARGGERAEDAISDFYNLLTMKACPKYAVWCMGMNNGRDTDGNPNPTWMSATLAFIATCQERGIEPILATIPTVPSETHTKMNEWVRESGYRYIDLAAAVEEEGTNTWRGWGTDNALLSDDQVHPSAHGAAELACRVLIDFPEFTIMPN